MYLSLLTLFTADRITVSHMADLTAPLVMSNSYN